MGVSNPVEPSAEFFVQFARELGLDRAFYPIEEGFREIGLSHAFGWRLVKSGDLPTIRLAKRKTVIAAVDLARFVHRRRQSPPEPKENPNKSN